MKVSSKDKNGWVPVSLGFYPEEFEDVQVTYLGCFDKKLLCNEIAYRVRDGWRWTFNGSIPSVEIIAWKHIGEPYQPKQRTKVKIERRKRNELRKDKE